MSDFSKTKKWQKNKNREVSFFVKYRNIDGVFKPLLHQLNNPKGYKHFGKEKNHRFVLNAVCIRISLLLIIQYMI